MSDNEKPKRPHPDVRAEGEPAPSAKFDSPPLGGSGQEGALSSQTAGMIAGMTREERDAFFRDLLTRRTSKDIARIYGISETYLAVIADDE